MIEKVNKLEIGSIIKNLGCDSKIIPLFLNLSWIKMTSVSQAKMIKILLSREGKMGNIETFDEE